MKQIQKHELPCTNISRGFGIPVKSLAVHSRPSNHFKGLNTYVLESHTTKDIRFWLIQRKLYFEQHYLLQLIHNFPIALSKSWRS